MVTSSIIIPVYNHIALTRGCVEAILAEPPPPGGVDIVVVDDGSEPAVVDALGPLSERLRVIRHTQNAGFAAACNDGAAAATGNFLIFLNNDTVPQPGWLDALLRYAEDHPGASVVGSKLLFPNGTVQHAGVVVCQDHYPRHIYAGFPGDHPAVNVPRQYQIVTGACALIRREAFEQAGGFDTRFKNGYEDVDLCLRLRELGYEVHYCPSSVVHHLESASRGDVPSTVEDNDHLYRERWYDRVQPDDMYYYLQDGLLDMAFGPGEAYPARLKLSPLLAVLDDEHRDEVERLLNTRSRQVFDLIKENIRLTTLLLEAQASDRSPTPGNSSMDRH